MEAFGRLPPLDIALEQLWPEATIHTNLRDSGRPPAFSRAKTSLKSLPVKLPLSDSETAVQADYTFCAKGIEWAPWPPPLARGN